MLIDQCECSYKNIKTKLLNFMNVFFYKKNLYKKLEAEKGSKNKKFLRNEPG